MEADSVEGADLEGEAVGPGNSTGQPRRRSATYLMEGLIEAGPDFRGISVQLLRFKGMASKKDPLSYTEKAFCEILEE